MGSDYRVETDDDVKRHGKGCRSKVAYPSKRVATGMARMMRRRYGSPFDAYHCVSCRSWHVGNHRDGRAPRG